MSREPIGNPLASFKSKIDQAANTARNVGKSAGAAQQNTGARGASGLFGQAARSIAPTSSFMERQASINSRIDDANQQLQTRVDDSWNKYMEGNSRFSRGMNMAASLPGGMNYNPWLNDPVKPDPNAPKNYALRREDQKSRNKYEAELADINGNTSPFWSRVGNDFARQGILNQGESGRNVQMAQYAPNVNNVNSDKFSNEQLQTSRNMARNSAEWLKADANRGGLTGNQLDNVNNYANGAIDPDKMGMSAAKQADDGSGINWGDQGMLDEYGNYIPTIGGEAVGMNAADRYLAANAAYLSGTDDYFKNNYGDDIGKILNEYGMDENVSDEDFYRYWGFGDDTVLDPYHMGSTATRDQLARFYYRNTMDDVLADYGGHEADMTYGGDAWNAWYDYLTGLNPYATADYGLAGDTTAQSALWGSGDASARSRAQNLVENGWAPTLDTRNQDSWSEDVLGAYDDLLVDEAGNMVVNQEGLPFIWDGDQGQTYIDLGDQNLRNLESSILLGQVERYGSLPQTQLSGKMMGDQRVSFVKPGYDAPVGDDMLHDEYGLYDLVGDDYNSQVVNPYLLPNGYNTEKLLGTRLNSYMPGLRYYRNGGYA